MSRKIGARALPYYSSYEHDRRAISKLIAMLLETKRRGYDVLIENVRKEKIDKVNSLGRVEWYETAKTAGFFSSPSESEVFRLYNKLYEKIKEKYGEKRRSVSHRNVPYWLHYFYFQKNKTLFLKPKEECMEIMRSMVCSVFDDIKKKFERSIIYIRFSDALRSYIAKHYGDERISIEEFMSLALSSDYTKTFIGNYKNRIRLIKKLREDGVEVKIIPSSERIKNLVFHNLQGREEKFLSSAELNEIIEGFSVMLGGIGGVIRANVRMAVGKKYFIAPSSTLKKVLKEACSLCSNGKIEKREFEELIKRHYSHPHRRFFERARRALAAVGIIVE